MSSSLSIAGGVTSQPISQDKLARLTGLLYLSLLPTAGFGIMSAQSLLENGGSAAAVGSRLRYSRPVSRASLS